MEKFSTLPACVLLTAVLSSPVQADFLGFTVGLDQWTPGLDGTFEDITSGSSIGLKDDFGSEDPSSSSPKFSFEHPIPLLPNVRVQPLILESEGGSTLTAPFTFDGQTYANGENIISTFDLSHNDIVLYFEILDNWINLDVGFNFKQFNGEISAVGDLNTTKATKKIEETIPLMFIAARFDLPFTGLYAGGEISTLSFDNNKVDDVTVKVGYESGSGFGVEGGFRTFTIKLDDVSDITTDIKYDGAFVNAFYHF